MGNRSNGCQLGLYRRSPPQQTPLWKLLNDHFYRFEKEYGDLFQKKYGFYRPIISHVVTKYLECGGLREGFARIKYPDCQHEYLLLSVAGGVGSVHHLKENVFFRFLIGNMFSGNNDLVMSNIE